MGLCKKFEDLCVESMKMSSLLEVLSRGAAEQDNHFKQDDNHFWLYMEQALSIASSYQIKICDELFEILNQLENRQDIPPGYEKLTDDEEDLIDTYRVLCEEYKDMVRTCCFGRKDVQEREHPSVNP